MRRLFAVIIVLATGIAGCAPSHQITVTSGKPRAVGAVANVPAKPERAPPLAAPSAPAVVAAKPRTLLEPEVLIGRTEVEIARAFGEPALVRTENPAEVWQYLTADCALHLFFYPDAKAATVVRHVAINGRNLETFSDLDRRQCFNDYLRSVGAEKVFVTDKTS